MDKVIEVPSKVADLPGLYLDLQRADFSVRNVGSDAAKTYVYLESAEEKDPTPIVEEWALKPMPTPKEMMARAIRWKAEIEEIRAKKEEALRKAEADRVAAEATLEAEPPEEEPDERPSLLRRIFRKLW